MDINVLAVTGRLTGDLESRQTQSGKTVCKGTIAIGGYKKEEVHFVDFTWWPAKPEHVAYFHKGDRVSISGSLKQDRWTDQSGQKQQRVNILAQSLVSMEKAPSSQPQQQGGFGQSAPQQQGGFGQQQTQQSFPTSQQGGFGQQQAGQNQMPTGQNQTSSPDHFNDENIPF